VARPTLAGAILFALVAIAGITGCGEDDDGAPAASSIPATPWMLTGGIDVEGWQEVAPSVTFENGQVAGSTGCNRFTAPQTIKGDTLDIGEVAATQMACTGAAVEVERAFLAALDQVRSWRIDSDALVLLGDDDKELLRFEVPSPVGVWVVTSLLHGDAVTSPIAGTELTATFTRDGKVTGSAGCNTYTTTYRGSDGGITIAKPATTRKLCATPDGVMEQERAFLAALAATTSYRVEGARLSLLTARGTFTATFERAP
jgi:heat shock protein HslJ